MWFKLIATLLSGIGALLPYLASRRQQLLTNASQHTAPIPRWAGWLLFTLCQALAIYCLTFISSPLVASLTVLVQLMCYWIALILLAAHQPKAINTLLIILGLGIIIALLGNTHGG